MSPRLCVVLAAALVVPVGAHGAERLTDEQVKKLIEDIDSGYETWKKDLEKQNLDDAVITSAERTINVKTFLKDFEKSIDTVKGRFKSEYAATPEVLALLRLGSDVEQRNRRQADPSSAWMPLGTKLESLARAYDVGWPLQSMQVKPVRLNDGELAAKVQQMEGAAKQVRSETERAAKANKAIDKASRESLKASIVQVEQMAKGVRTRIKDDRPASVEVGQLLAQTAKVDGTIKQLALPAPTAWAPIARGNEALARAYALSLP